MVGSFHRQSAAIWITPSEIGTEEVSAQIYWMRFSRTLLAVIAGSGLAISGLVFQALFRNPLATPYTLGIASGAAFGASAAIQLTHLFRKTALFGLFFLGIPVISWSAFAGAILAMVIVFSLARPKDASSDRMLLAGVAVNFFFSSLILLLQYIAQPHDVVQMLRWSMGGVNDASWRDIGQLAPLVIVAGGILFFLSRELNIIVTGQEHAMALGINVYRLRTGLFLLFSLLVAAIVAVTGPIGFVGLMVPHIARLFVGPDHRWLVPTTLFCGGLFLAICDSLARTLMSPAELPVGVLTSLLGGPFFLFLLLRNERRL